MTLCPFTALPFPLTKEDEEDAGALFHLLDDTAGGGGILRRSSSAFDRPTVLDEPFVRGAGADDGMLGLVVMKLSMGCSWPSSA